MANTRTVDFLPEIFQTPANKQFLSATLDQLVQEPRFRKTQGFVGRRVGPGVNPNDSYVVELDQTRTDYQLEPGVVKLDASGRQVLDAITYPGINDALRIQGAAVNNSDRLYTSDYYTWDPFVDFDKYINYSQYFWIPDGPTAVNVFEGGIPLTNEFDVTKTNTGYQFSSLAGTNPSITLVRGGTYTFNVDQSTQFWIQQNPGTSGQLIATPNISGREIFGVVNNGVSSGTLTFNVPTKDQQEFFFDLPDVGPVDLVTDLKFNQINNIFVSEFLRLYGGIDGITNLNGLTVILTNQEVNPESGGWLASTQFDPLTEVSTNNGLPGSFDSLPYDLETVVPPADRYSIWRIQYVSVNGSAPYIRLVQPQSVPNLSKLSVLFGTQWSNTQWWKNNSGFWELVPNLTTLLDTLFYQDGTDPLAFGALKIIDQEQRTTLDINDIIGQKNYVSPNGVVFTNNLKVVFRGDVTPASYLNNEYYVAGVGSAIKLLPVSNYVTPDQYIDQDVVDILDIPDYLVMSLDSPSLSAWSRVNRWFHIDVITATAEYTNTDIVINNEFRAKRPILEYRGGLKLFNMGTQAAPAVNVVDLTESDALSNVNGSIGLTVDGYQLVNGSTIVFAADVDPAVRNKIYSVEFILPDFSSTTPVIKLVEVYEILPDQTVLSLNGIVQKGVTYYYTGIEWVRAQQKTARNQAPLFDVYDLDGVSYSNNIKYSSTSFQGTKLLSYAVGSGVADSVLGFPLQYLTLTNVGDIVFDNNFYTDTFSYVRGNVGTTENISNGVVREYLSRTEFITDIGWQSAITKSRVYQQFRFSFDSDPVLILDVPVVANTVVPNVKVYVGGVFQVPGSFDVQPTTSSTIITLGNPGDIPRGTIIEVLALSNVPSQVGFYQVPENLENNPLNGNSNRYTLGTARAHYQTIAENLVEFQGQVNGANNIRDLGNVIPYGLKILQQSSPLTLAGYFLRSNQYNIFSSLEYNSREYEKLKAQILATAIDNDYNNMSVPAILDAILEEITAGRTEINPFYWSDMMPTGSVFTETRTVFTAISVPVFDTLRVYNFASANYQGLLVYVNNQQLLRGTEYVVATDGPRLTITRPLSVGDVIVIREYSDTAGSFVPNTPTKLGLYPAFRPEIYLDTTYVDPTIVIRGHDGSITVGFADFRDELLLEFERRIYNNLKLDGNPVPLTAADVVPGQFRTTDYSLREVNEILGRDFLIWIGWNKIDYKTQDYKPLNEFTYNYSAASNKLTNNQPLAVGGWRGIYNYFYDTTTPNTTPWQMLGFSQQPDWWENYYGPAPYTSGNLVLWDDLENGLVRDPAGAYIIPKYRRPGLTSVIPSGEEGALLSPLNSVVGNYTSTDFRKSWTVGDDGPAENAWRTSSSYPFAVMRLLALTRPAEFFSLFADRDLYRFDDTIGQYLYNRRYRLDANGIVVYGNGVSKASFIDWIVDFNRQSGINSTEQLSTDLQSLGVRLCYRMAAFSAKNLLQIYTEKSSPDSVNSELLLPDESYNLLLYKNVPFDTLTYSSVVVQRTEQGYAVFGYSNVTPYFNILQSRPTGAPTTISAGGVSVQVSTAHTDQVVLVPYGFVFATATGVADFLISYGALLQSQGMIFTDVENGYVLNWQQMVAEFLYWTSQAWAPGSIINLNPNATKLLIDRPFSIVDNISLQTQENIVLDQDGRQLTTKDLIIDRQENRFSIETTNSQTISFINLKFVSYEHMVVLDNRSIFADLIYDPVTDARQNRIKLIGAISEDWNGQLNAPGFILNQDNIKEWQPGRKYAKGEIVLFKNLYYSALDIVEPSEKFNFSQWTRSDFTEIQQGLLPNLANKSDQLANTYDIYSANLERNQDLFSYGLIGFKPREYMTALNLDDVSQVNLYRQFLGTKGTLQAAELFKFADIGRGATEFDIYENWAVQRATYGANANRSYYELQLNEALLKFNPSLIQVIEPGQQSRADQTVFINDIWKESFNIQSPNILSTINEFPTDIGLPTAGYVNHDDVDVTVFDIEDPTALNESLDSIGIDTRIWVAKTNSYDWGIFRCFGVPGFVQLVSNNLDGTSTVTFTRQHNLATNDTIIIKFFDIDINGVYRVLSTPSLTTITIAYEFIGVEQIAINGKGIALGLETLRVAQASDALELPESVRLNPGAKIWVDNNGNNQWQVIEKQNVFTVREQLEPTPAVANSRFGASADQARNNLFAIVGQPEFSESGAAVFYIQDNQGNYQQTDIQESTAAGSRLFGHSVSIGNQNWAAIGAPDSQWEPLDSSLLEKVGFVTVINRPDGSGQFIQTQLLTPPVLELDQPCEFGYSTAVSQNQQWLYVGAPGINRVYAYGLVGIEDQAVVYITPGVTTIDGALITVTGGTNIYNYASSIVVNSTDPSIAATQLSVVINDQPITDFTVNVSTGQIVIGAIPELTSSAGVLLPGLRLTIARKSVVAFEGAEVDVENIPLSNFLYTADSIEAFAVYVNRNIQRPNIDYVYEDGVVQFVETEDNWLPGSDDLIEFRAGSYYQYVDELAPPEAIESDARFGVSVTCSTDGRQVMIGANRKHVNAVPDAGAVYVYDRSVQRFIVNENNQITYQINVPSLVRPTAVQLNQRFLTNGEYSVSGNTVTLVNSPNIGDQVIINVNTFNFIQKVTADQPQIYGLFGSAIDICSNDCSLYVGAPGDIAIRPQQGRVQRNINQSRVYGVLTSPVANPLVDVDDTIRINDVEVVVPANEDLSQPTVKDLVRAINSTGIPNVVASVTADLTLIANGLDTDFFIGSIYSSATQFTPVVFVGSVLQELDVDYTYNNSTETISFDTAPRNRDVITVVSGRLVLTAKNKNSLGNENELTALPGIASPDLWQRLEFNIYAFTQTISSPVELINDQFGSSIVVDTNATTLVVGAPQGNAIQQNTFDSGTTIFDANATTFLTVGVRSGVVYTFDLLRSVNSSIENPDKFVFGQQIFDSQGATENQFGTAVSYVNRVLLTTSPGYSTTSVTGSGKINLYINENNSPAWVPVRQQQPVVDVSLINSVFAYDAITSAKTDFFDFIDPLQGKILGAAQQNIDFIGAVDPAAYNVGLINNYGKLWGDLYVGQIWWDTNNTRFIDPHQDDITYASRRWSQLFPGSTVDVYQWIVSDVPPADYAGEGIPRSIESYSVSSEIDATGVFKTKYYFWVRGISSIASNAGKTLSAQTVARYVENPRASGIPYVAFINSSTTAIYNALGLISAQDTILSIEFDRQRTDDTVHVEYELIPQDRADGFLSATLYRKFQDSMCGVDTAGNLVPDVNLRPANRYGVQFRPRQSMFVDRFAALQNYLTRVNSVLLQFPISETRSFSLLNSQEPEPTSVAIEPADRWNKRVANIEELSYQNFLIVPEGYRYLVVSDSTQGGLWTIYEVTADKTFASLLLVRVQTYKTDRYWSYVDWYQVGYNPSIRPVLEVNNVSDLDTITVPLGSSVRVRANSQGKFEIYLLENTGWVRVGLEDGTIEFNAELWNYQLGRFGFDVEVFDSQYFDQEPVIETRKIIQAINQELLIDELAIERNRAMVLMFNYILSEQIAPEWITKTSLIDVDHKIRQLLPYQIYNRDNQEFVIDYIQEVKPYHVQVREFNLIYEGFDIYGGTVTDFDVPAYWKTDLAIPQFVSPILTPYDLSTAVGTGRANTISDAGPDNDIWRTEPWSFWYQNYSLGIESVTVINGGSGYFEAPTITVEGDAIEPAVLTATVSGAGVITAINVINPGSGYLLTPTIVVSGADTGARFYPVMGNNLVRNIKTTIKYDRYQYQTDIVDWQPGVSYSNETLVRFDDRVWEAIGEVESEVFDPDQWNLVPAGTLSGIDRTQGYYDPRPNMPGLDLPLLIDGLDYPGVQVTGPLFSQNTGFDIGNFDTNPFDNISFGPEGRPTYDPGILDAIYESRFLDTFLGTRPTDINVSGGAFVDTYSSHAPEELVPGSEFDTLDFKVFTTPGSDWTGDGHGWPSGTVSFEFRPEISIQELFAVVGQSLLLINLRTQQSLIFNVDYTIDFQNLTVTFFPPSVQVGDQIQTTVFAIGTADVIFSGVYTYLGPDQALPAPSQLLAQLSAFINAEGVTVVSFEGLVKDPVAVNLSNESSRRSLTAGIDYVVDWVDQTVTVFATNTNVGNGLQLTVYGIGGGNQLFKQSYVGTDIGRSVFIPMTFSLITQPVVFVNGELNENYGIFPENAGTLMIFDQTFGPSDYVTIVLLSDTPEIIPIVEPFDSTPFDSGTAPDAAGSFDFSGISATGSILDFGWSVPTVQNFIVAPGQTVFTLTNSFIGTNRATAIVELNGIRVASPAGVEYIADGSLAYQLPTRLGFSQAEILDTDVLVWVNNELQELGVDYTIEPFIDGDAREVIFTTVPETGSDILIFVTTDNSYIITPGATTSTLTWRNGFGFDLSVGDTVSITSWNDTDQQRILNKVFVGPEVIGTIIAEGYDSTDFDEGTTSNEPGSFDFSTGSALVVNNFDLGRTITDLSRLWVTRNGNRLYPFKDFTIEDQRLILASGAISAADKITVTMFTENIVPDAIAFRIFQDMRGVAATYRITANTTTELTQALLPTDNIIRVKSAEALSVPDIDNNIWGVLTVNGERIMYREIDLVANTVSSLLRGTAGTAIATHPAKSVVYDMSRVNLAPVEYQDRLVSSTYLADGVETEFVTDIDLSRYNFEFAETAVEVYVGGTLQQRVVDDSTETYIIVDTDPVTVLFADAPPEGVEVVVVVRQGLSWYQPGPFTASDGIPLQETNTIAARFFRDLY